MPPNFLFSNPVDQLRSYAVGATELCKSVAYRETSAYLKDLLLSKLSHWVRFAFRNSVAAFLRLVAVNRVLFWSHVLKIANRIVTPVSVDVVYLMACWDRAKECFSDKPMHLSVRCLSRSVTQIKDEVSVSVVGRFNEPWKWLISMPVSSVRFNPSYLTEAGCFVNALPSNNRFPYV